MYSCLVCGSQTDVVVEVRGAYKILHCSSCGLQFADPMTASTSNYKSAYDLGQAPAEVAGEGLPFLGWTEDASEGLTEFNCFMTAAQQFALKIIKKRFPKDQASLDVGFGAGWFLGAMRQAGLRPHGLEVAENPIKILSQKGFSVGNYAVEKLPLEWPSPALITAFEVVEHLEDPVGFLTLIRKTYPQADVILSVPDEKCWFFLGGRPAHDYPPNHMTRWSPRAMDLALRKAGYAHAKVWQVRPTAQEISMASVRRFLPFKALSRAENGVSNTAVGPSTSLVEELKKRSLRRKLALPIAAFLPLIGKTACSMVAMGSNQQIN